MPLVSLPSTNSTLVFKVTRREPELIKPAKQTPYVFKPLSDLDDQDAHKFFPPVIYIYRYNPCMRGKDPVSEIRDAIAKTLVFYYPFAGRLREIHGRKLVVECTGEGVMFTEAIADVTIDQLGDENALIRPPFPCIEELLFDVPGSASITNSPLLLFQATRTVCGGFILAVRLNHTMSDGTGFVQLMTAIGEIARGALVPSVTPVWNRELLCARIPPRVSFTHHEYEEVSNTKGMIIPVNDDMACQWFFFGPTEVASLRSILPPHLRTCSSFDLVTACLWRCRTIALECEPMDQVRVLLILDARSKFIPPLPNGYYGNCVTGSSAISSSEKLCQSPFGYAVELVRIAKDKVNEDYMRSLLDMLVLKGRPRFSSSHDFLVSDHSGLGLEKFDFGCGEVVYGGSADGGPPGGSVYVGMKNEKGEKGRLVRMSLTSRAMARFAKEVSYMTRETPVQSRPRVFIPSRA